MNKKIIIFLVGSFLSGMGVGFGITKYVEYRKMKQNGPLEEISDTEVEEPTNDTENASKEEIDGIMKDLGYIPEDSEEEVQEVEEWSEEEAESIRQTEWYERNKDRIVSRPRDEYPGDLFPEYREDDWECKQLRYFVDENILCDDDNGIIFEPLEAYVGEVFSKFDWTNSYDEEIYIKNFPLQSHFLIVKEKKLSYGEFGYVE